MNKTTATTHPTEAWDGRPDAPCLGKHCDDIVGNTYSMNQLCESCADDDNAAEYYDECDGGANCANCDEHVVPMT